MRRTRVSFALREPEVVFRSGDRRLALGLAGAYAAFAIAGGVLAYYFSGGRPFEHPAPWLVLPPVAAAALSIAIGVAFAFAIVVTTRITVARFEWARRLHLELQPVARRFGTGETLLIAAFSSLGEEMFFRAFLVPTIGVIGSSLLFGLLHQVRGQSRWVWAAWATGVGLFFALLYVATGSLLGPIVAHALINATNLTFLKKHDLTGPHPLAPSP
ncbi:MAG: CPBP family intramembrane metalloprotease [Polyangiaceae bacterium]|nr:CPBP family intramembrane metalloprotease [Polyangiaceae bacterium]